VGDDVTIFVKPGMKEGFYLREEMDKLVFEAKLYFVIAAVLVVAGIIMQVM
jgi:hypothetical protein